MRKPIGVRERGRGGMVRGVVALVGAGIWNAVAQLESVTSMGPGGAVPGIAVVQVAPMGMQGGGGIRGVTRRTRTAPAAGLFFAAGGVDVRSAAGGGGNPGASGLARRGSVGRPEGGEPGGVPGSAAYARAMVLLSGGRAAQLPQARRWLETAAGEGHPVAASILERWRRAAAKGADE